MEKHFTVTAYIIHEQKVLLLYHPKFTKWLPPGGHLEANETPIEGVRREVEEETGLQIAFITDEHIWHAHANASSFERPYLCLLENVPAHKDKPAHQHIDLIYLARPIGGRELSEQERDYPLRWFSLDEVQKLTPDQEIFAETQKTIQHILTHQNDEAELLPMRED